MIERDGSLPTPCAGWSVADVVDHVVAGNHLFRAVLRGEDPPASSPPETSKGDRVEAYRRSAGPLLEAFRQPGAMEKVVKVPFGTVPGAVALHLRVTELLVHGWDLARATRQPATFPERVAGEELAFPLPPCRPGDWP